MSRRAPMAVLAAAVVLAALGAAAAPALAAPRKTIVLQLDGPADAEARARLTAAVQRLARTLDGEVQSGDTTLAETAVAVGCDPAAPACVESVRDTLGVDELVHGFAAPAPDDRLELTFWRVRKAKPPHRWTATIAAHDPPDRVNAALLPLFDEIPEPAPGTSVEPPPHEPATSAPAAAVVDARPRSLPPARDRNLGIAATTGGSVAFLIGLALWSAKSSLQTQIDAAPTSTPADFATLVDLEDRARARAWAGNVMVLGGAALAGYGIYLLRRDHRARRVVVTPAPMGDVGGGVTLTLIGGLR